jgi:hypothetical protein
MVNSILYKITSYSLHAVKNLSFKKKSRDCQISFDDKINDYSNFSN